MAETFDGAVKVSVSGTLAKDIDVGIVNHSLAHNIVNTFANGTALNQANEIWVDTRTLAASATENLDLSGILVNAVGTTISFTSIKGIIIQADSANINSVQIGGHASAAFVNWVANATDIVNVRPGGCFALTAPDATAYAVTATTGDLLKITNSGGTTGVTYTIILIGTV